MIGLSYVMHLHRRSRSNRLERPGVGHTYHRAESDWLQTRDRWVQALEEAHSRVDVVIREHHLLLQVLHQLVAEVVLRGPRDSRACTRTRERGRGLIRELEERLDRSSLLILCIVLELRDGQVSKREMAGNKEDRRARLRGKSTVCGGLTCAHTDEVCTNKNIFAPVRVWHSVQTSRGESQSAPDARPPLPLPVPCEGKEKTAN